MSDDKADAVNGAAALADRKTAADRNSLPGASAFPDNEPAHRLYRNFRLGLIITTAVLGTLTLLLLIPGVRLQPTLEGDKSALNAELATIERRNDELRREIASLEDVLVGGVCRAPDQILQAPDGAPISLPDSRLTEDLTVPDMAMPDGAGTFAGNLAEFLKRSVVLVATPTGSGTGFFVAPDLVLTNAHVIRGKSGEPQTGIVIVSRNHQSEEVELVEIEGPTTAGAPDFALLRVQSGGGAPLVFTEQAHQLQKVVAIGYPGIHIKTNRSSIPDASLMRGDIHLIQNLGIQPTVIHSAPISKGNSGGPLTDLCGRVVGVNTFGIGDKPSEIARHSLFSQQAIAFLRKSGATPAISSGTCTPKDGES